MSGRGGSGRGALLRLLAESLEESSTSGNSRETDSHIGQSTLDSGLGLKPAGRGRLLLDDTEISPSILSTTAGQGPSSEGSSGIEATFLKRPTQGRGMMLNLLKEGTMVASREITEETIEPVTADFEEMKIESETEPVIRHGSKG